MTTDPSGDLLIETAAGTVRHLRPLVYQEADGGRRIVDGEYLASGSRVGFRVGEYDRARPLVIDPVIPPSHIVFSTYFGGGGSDEGNSVVIDGGGSAYVTGYTTSTNFPVTRGAYQTAAPASDNAFVTKLNSAGSGLQYSTYLGGSGRDAGRAIAVNGAGEVYLTGSTSSADFPVTFNAYDETYNGGATPSCSS